MQSYSNFKYGHMVDVMAAAMYPSVSLGIPGRSALTPPNKSF